MTIDKDLQEAFGSFIPKQAYVAPISDIALEVFSSKLENIKVGMQEFAEGDAKPISTFIPPNSVIKDIIHDGFVVEVSEQVEQKQISEEDIKNAAKEVRKAHYAAVQAQKKRVSRRLLLAERAKKLTVVCPITGIVSLLEVPAIPFKALIYSHPCSELANARGMAQQGFSYLKNLDTQVLAGLLIVLAESYDLFRFQPYDSGAQKNALLRTAGKELLIAAILLIEDQVHSKNNEFLPKLSLVFDPFLENHGVDNRLSNYLKLLSEAIEAPDKERWEENKVKKIGKPLLIKDVESAATKISFLARQEISKAKKEFEADKKAGKQIISELFTKGKVSQKMKIFVNQLLTENALLEAASDLIQMLIAQKLALIDGTNELIKILEKDRKILLMETSEIEEIVKKRLPQKEQEAASFVEKEVGEAKARTDSPPNNEKKNKETEEIPTPPEGLSNFEKILWIKKWKASKKITPEPWVAYKSHGNPFPPVHTYEPSVTKQKLGGQE